MSQDKPGNTDHTRRDLFRTLGTGALITTGLPLISQAQSKAPVLLAPAFSAEQKKGIVPPNKSYRVMEWECHTPPEGNFDIDVKGAVTAARDAGAQSMMLYAQDHWGYAFYPTEFGVRHPHLKGDFLGSQVAEARKQGMSTICYYSTRFNNQAVLNHPDWGWVNEKGEQQRARWYLACVDGPYRQYMLSMIGELFALYEFDQLFLDIIGYHLHRFHNGGPEPFCYCKYTEAAWNRDYPGDPYRAGFKTREGWDLRYRWLQKHSLDDLFDEIVAAARRHKPNTLIVLNGGPERYSKQLMEKVNFIYAEPLTSDTGISLGSILMRGWDRPDYQAGVFSQQGYLDTYPGVLPRVKADALIVQNARTFIVGNAPLIGDLDGQGFSKRWFETAKETWEDVRNVDSRLEGIQPMCSTAMLYSEATREELAGQKQPLQFRQTVIGALEALTYVGRPVESLPEFRITTEELAKYEALVLPEVEVLSDAHADVIRRWVEKGGTVVASYNCGLLDEQNRRRINFPLADVFGVDYVSEERKYAYDKDGKPNNSGVSIYLESAGHPLASMIATSTVGLPGSFLNVKRTTAQEVMRYRLPFMVEDIPHNKWFNWGPPPPGTETAGTAAAYNKFGKGQALYIGVPIFRAIALKDKKNDRFWTRQWVRESMRQLVPLPIAELASEQLPEYVHGTLFWTKDKRAILVQVLNAVELATNGQFIPVPSVHLNVSAKLNVKSASIFWPKEQSLDVKTLNGRTRIVIPNPERYTALLLKIA
jgi:hypothetical protein